MTSRRSASHPATTTWRRSPPTSSTAWSRAAPCEATTSESSIESPLFPTSSFAYAYDLKPDLVNKIRECFFNFRFTPEMIKEFDGNDRFFPITYKEHWAVVREIAEKTGTPFNKTAYDAEAKREPRRCERAADSPGATETVI